MRLFCWLLLLFPSSFLFAENSYTNLIPEAIALIANYDRSKVLDFEKDCVFNMLYYANNMINNINNRKSFEAEECAKKYVAYKVELGKLLEMETQSRVLDYVSAQRKLLDAEEALKRIRERRAFYLLDSK